MNQTSGRYNLYRFLFQEVDNSFQEFSLFRKRCLSKAEHFQSSIVLSYQTHWRKYNCMTCITQMAQQLHRAIRNFVRSILTITLAKNKVHLFLLIAFRIMSFGERGTKRLRTLGSCSLLYFSPLTLILHLLAGLARASHFVSGPFNSISK